MSMTLEQFVEEVKQATVAFEADYRANHADMPDVYPLALPDDNAGLWTEFFIDFMSHYEPEEHPE